MEILIQAMFKNNLNVTQTASDVYMHRNTVIKKLDFIKKETGLNLQKFQDANIMYWILKIR
jgi:carbohydrate diacid regulator